MSNPDTTRVFLFPAIYSLFPLFTSSLIHSFTVSFHSSLFTQTCSTSHWAQIPPILVCKPIIPINMTVFLFSCESAFCGTSSANQPPKRPLGTAPTSLIN
jgi:hypothetical protein